MTYNVCRTQNAAGGFELSQVGMIPNLRCRKACGCLGVETIRLCSTEERQCSAAFKYVIAAGRKFDQRRVKSCGSCSDKGAEAACKPTHVGTRPPRTNKTLDFCM